ncbi:hypothetical protein ACGRHY_28710 [Streptomyces sp. HK10]|uniref:hypothetical protein n=1 Tax=Streptomyces sp. HK10 TaxID=3373255 RepID=UPI003747B85D
MSSVAHTPPAVAAIPRQPGPAAPRPTVPVHTVEVRTHPQDVPALPGQVMDAIGQVVPVAAVEPMPGGLTAHLADGARLRVLAGPPAQPRSRPAGTVQLTVLLEDSGRLPQETADRLMGAVERIPFTALECAELAGQMPLTHHLPEHLPSGALTGIAPVLTVHHMSDFLVLVDAVMRLGVPAQAITVLDKGYRYLHTARVDAHLAALGVRVWPWEQAADALADHTRRAREMGLRGLLVDDGGYTLPVLIEQRPDLLDIFCGLVEQTMSGITKLQPYGDRLPVPVFSVAQSQLKATIEPYGIADAAWRNLVRLLPQEKFEGQAALVLGFGRIGAQLAEVLRTRRMRVAVHDRSTAALVAAMEHGFTTGPVVTELLEEHRPLLIVGSTGRTSLSGEHTASLHRDCYLVSVTSRDREFALEEMRQAATAVSDAGRLGFRLHLPQQITATVIADGYPINFHYAESLPNKYADLVLASLIVGAATLAADGHGFTAGHNVARTDQVLEGSGLLERYYTRFGPQEGSR